MIVKLPMLYLLQMYFFLTWLLIFTLVPFKKQTLSSLYNKDTLTFRIHCGICHGCLKMRIIFLG